jgi:hypothetical protein
VEADPVGEVYYLEGFGASGGFTQPSPVALSRADSRVNFTTSRTIREGEERICRPKRKLCSSAQALSSGRSEPAELSVLPRI